MSLYTMEPRTGGYTPDVGVWDSSMDQAPRQTLTLRSRTFASLYAPDRFGTASQGARGVSVGLTSGGAMGGGGGYIG
jgi:hypothetical protein